MSLNIPAELKWTHLLYVTGDDVDWALIEKELSAFSHFPLGPHCWLVRPPLPAGRNLVADRIQSALPEPPRKSEMFLCPISRYAIVRTTQSGYGLDAWLKQGNAAE